MRLGKLAFMQEGGTCHDHTVACRQALGNRDAALALYGGAGLHRATLQLASLVQHKDGSLAGLVAPHDGRRRHGDGVGRAAVRQLDRHDAAAAQLFRGCRTLRHSEDCLHQRAVVAAGGKSFQRKRE